MPNNNAGQIEFAIAPSPGWEAARDAFQAQAMAAAEATRAFRGYSNTWGDWADLDREAAQQNERDRERLMPANAQPITLRVSRGTQQAQAVIRNFSLEKAKRAMDDQGYTQCQILYEIPGPYPDNAAVGAVEVFLEDGVQDGQRRIFTFRIRSGELTVHRFLTEAEYTHELRRRGPVDHFYTAQVEGRRRLSAKLLAGGAENYQLLLSIADDDTIRQAMTSKEFRKAMNAPEMRARMAAARMEAVRLERVRTVPAPTVSSPDSDRGQRAANAVQRRPRRSRPEFPGTPRSIQGEDRVARFRTSGMDTVRTPARQAEITELAEAVAGFSENPPIAVAEDAIARPSRRYVGNARFVEPITVRNGETLGVTMTIECGGGGGGGDASASGGNGRAYHAGSNIRGGEIRGRQANTVAFDETAEVPQQFLNARIGRPFNSDSEGF